MKKRFLFSAFPLCFVFFLSVLFSGCKSSSDRAQDKKDFKTRESFSAFLPEIREIEKNKENALDKFLESLSLEDKVSQLFLENLQGDTVFVPVEKINVKTGETGIYKGSFSDSDEEKALIPGGFIFFSYNIRDDIEGAMYFTDSIRSFCYENRIIPPFLAVDQEGGFVNRLRVLNGPLPSNRRVSDNLPPEKAYELYSLQGKQMRALGFNMNLSPVVEAIDSENEKFLGERSFGSAGKVFEYGKSCVNAYQNNKIAAVLKHFPGNTNVDPHSGLPEIDSSEKRLSESLAPFKMLSEYNPCGVLMSHARVSVLDSETPACLSEKWVTEKLRGEYGFSGLVFSDDIFMAALKENGFPPEKACRMAIEAGADVIMISEKRFASPLKMLCDEARKSSPFNEKINQAARRVLSCKIKAGLLEYRRTNPGKNDYEVVFSNPFESVEDRIVIFREAREKNIKLYIENFD